MSKSSCDAASFGVVLGIYRTGFEGPTHLGAAPAWAGRFNVPEVDVGWIGQGGQATHQLEQVISQPLASSTNSPLPSLRHFVPVSLRARLLSTDNQPSPSCLSVSHSPVCSNLPASASRLSGREPPPCPLPCPLHPSEDTRKQSLRSQPPRILSRDHTAPSISLPSSRRKLTTESEHTATRSSAASPPHTTMAESSNADAGETRPTYKRLSGLIGSCDTRIAGLVDLTARRGLTHPPFP